MSKDEWISVLKISTLWRSFGLRKLAIGELEKLTLDGVEKIVLGRKYFIVSWVEAGYVTLVKNREISDEQMDAIGAVESFKLMRIVVHRRHVLVDAIKEAFQAELKSITEAEISLRYFRGTHSTNSPDDKTG